MNLLTYGQQLVPAHDLARLLELPPGPPPRARPWVVMESEDGTVALGVEALLGQEEAVLKALSRPLDRVSGLAGVTILGNGRPLARCCGSADREREDDLFELIRHSPHLGLVGGVPVELELASERYLTLWTPIEDPTGRSIGAYVLQASLDEALGIVNSVRQTMLLLWLVALLAAILLSFRAARQLTSPIDGLSQAARRLSGGTGLQEILRGQFEAEGIAADFVPELLAVDRIGDAEVPEEGIRRRFVELQQLLRFEHNVARRNAVEPPPSKHDNAERWHPVLDEIE